MHKQCDAYGSSDSAKYKRLAGGGHCREWLELGNALHQTVSAPEKGKAKHTK